MLGDPTLVPIHSASEEALLGNLGPQSDGQGTCSHSQPSLLTEQQQPGQGSGDRLGICRSGCLWSPRWSNPPSALQPTRLLPRAREASHSPHPAGTSSRSRMAASRNAFDHLNPGCINSPNPFNSQDFLWRLMEVPSLAPWSVPRGYRRQVNLRAASQAGTRAAATPHSPS